MSVIDPMPSIQGLSSSSFSYAFYLSQPIGIIREDDPDSRIGRKLVSEIQVIAELKQI